MLDKEQAAAVRRVKGPQMILAGPGSGKTTVITERVRYLTEECAVLPGEILVVTFTKAAAAEMRSRYLRLTGAARSEVTFGTFHAVFFQILKQAYHLSAGNILREEMRFSIVRALVRREVPSAEDENELVNGVLGEIGLIKNSGIDPANYYSVNCAAAAFRRIYAGYEEEKKKRRLFDFDDMLTETRRLFTEREDILFAWRRRFRYFLIDEFQDINQVQYEIVKLLAAPENNLFIVGDDDQSIYRFRGARPEIMLRFPEDYPGCGRVLLRTNYRSSPEVVLAAENLISHNRSRFPKDLIASHPAGGSVRYLTFPDANAEYDGIVKELREHIERGSFPKKELALLFRTNQGQRRMVEALMKANIPFRMKDHLPNLYEHWIAKDIFAYFALSRGSNERSDLLRVMNRPKRYLSRELLTEDTFAFDVLEEAVSEKPWIAERLTDLRIDLRHLSRMNPFAGINYIRKGIGYDDFLPEYAEYRGIRSEELFDVLSELQDAARGFRTLEEFKRHIEEYTEELTRQAKDMGKQADAVTLSTLHSSKGLEYGCVYLVDVNEGVMPYRKAVLPEDLEEERRMVYVGMTRAKKSLTLCAVKETGSRGTLPSPYLKECQKRSETVVNPGFL